MPRLSPRLISQARTIDSFLPLLLRSCRDLSSARNELRWLREHLSRPRASARPRTLDRKKTLHRLCIERSRGKPLQYILGDQPFGALDMFCRSGVLIPRPETEAWASHLATLILNPSFPFPHGGDQPCLRILDLCTGTGCIALLLHSLLHRTHHSLQILGIDISPRAVALAHCNLHHNTAKKLLHRSAREQVRFEEADVFNSGKIWDRKWDIVVANPPYISPDDFNRTTARSVRNWEPKLALVPGSSSDAGVMGEADKEQAGDAFYPRVMAIAKKVSAKAVVMEVGGMAQAERVAARMVEGEVWRKCEVWRDGVVEGGGEVVEVKAIGATKIPVKGEGDGRVVVGWR
ncbi:MAG: hypothetical protein Q9185_006047 [Variospora sp. 1 TL-2023]